MINFDAVYAQKRDKALLEQRQRQENLFQKIPLLQELHKEHSALQASFALAKIKGASEKAQALEQKIERCLLEQKEILQQNGYAENYLDIWYDCPNCKDYGFIDGKPCICYQRMKNLSIGQHAAKVIQESCFDNFDLDIFPEKSGQRKQMQLLARTCYSYAENYPNNEKPNLLLLGKSGLGKSFLLNCVANHIESRGYVVMRITGNRFSSIVLNESIGKRNNLPFKQLCQAAFLVFDDLGSDPHVNEIVAQHFYALLEERIDFGRPWAIASNLESKELKERYGERTFSRLYDTNNTNAFELLGKDIRLFSEKAQKAKKSV